MSWRRGRQVEKQQCQSEATVEQWLLSMNACCLVLVGVGVTTHLVHAGGEQHGCSFFESEAPHGVLLSVKTACSKQHHQINHVTCEFRHAHTHTRHTERSRERERQRQRQRARERERDRDRDREKDRDRDRETP